MSTNIHIHGKDMLRNFTVCCECVDMKNSFEVQVRQHPTIVLVAKTPEEKNNWLGALFSLLTWRFVM